MSDGPPTIFIVDDDDTLRRSLARRIRAEGWDVETYASAAEFLERPPFVGRGCAILDVCLPELSGPALQLEMSARGNTLPVVFLTGHGDVTTGVNAMKRGAVDFLVKPVDDAVLLQTISQAIERHVAQLRARQQRRVTDDRLARLSPRELEVLGFVIAGRLNKQIAQSMGITLKTVKVHRAHVMQKMGVSSVAALVHLCEGARTRAPEGAAEAGTEHHGSKVQWPHSAEGAYPADRG
jgi:FixJ family two-component response regulator